MSPEKSAVSPPTPVDVPLPPMEDEALERWAGACGVASLLDLTAVSDAGPIPTYFSSGSKGATFRTLLTVRSKRPDSDREYVTSKARLLLQQWGRNAISRGDYRQWLALHGREPEPDSLVAHFLTRLRRLRSNLGEKDDGPPVHDALWPRVTVELETQVEPILHCHAHSNDAPAGTQLTNGPDNYLDVSVPLLGWEHAPLRLLHEMNTVSEREATPAEQILMLDSLIDFILDPRHEDYITALTDELGTPAWAHVLSSLDEAGAAPPASTQRGRSRIAYRLANGSHDTIDITPVLQTRQRNKRYTAGKKMQWFQPGLADLMTPADRPIFDAHNRPRIEGYRGWNYREDPEQVFEVLMALRDHPLVFWETDSQRRLPIRFGHVRLRFEQDTPAHQLPTARALHLRASLDVAGTRLSADELARALTPGGHAIVLRRDPDDESVREILLGRLSKTAAALVRALARAGTDFPPESHAALLARLQTLQADLDIEFPPAWTSTIRPARLCTTVRMELLASEALRIHFVVFPVAGGPAWAPGEGPQLVVDGVGDDRHGIKRDLSAEREVAHALAHQLHLDQAQQEDEEEREGPWQWRLPQGDTALDFLLAVKNLQKAQDPAQPSIEVQWADDDHMLSVASAGRSDLQLKVTDATDWFEVEGGVKIGDEVVPLAQLLQAIRAGRRFVRVSAGRFILLEDRLRGALHEAEPFLIESKRKGEIGIELGDASGGALIGLVENESQLRASRIYGEMRARVRAAESVLPNLPEALARTLRPYQYQGVSWMVQLSSWGAGCVLADDMGLGKTLQTLAVLQHRMPLGPALVVAPTSVVSNWHDEAARFTPDLKIHDFTGPPRTRDLKNLGPGDVVITSYAIATLEIERLRAIPFASAVFDEAQSFKNAATARAQALRQVDAQWKVALTGTPIENHLGELWSIFRCAHPGLFGSRERFRAVFSVPIEKFGDATRRAQLAQVIRPYVLRRTKAQVAPELPLRTDHTRKLTLSEAERDLYEQLRLSTLKEWNDLKSDPDRDAGEVRFILLASLTRLRQLCCHPRLVYPNTPIASTKLSAVVHLLEQLRESGHRALVFSQFRSLLDILAPQVRAAGLTCLTLDGTTPAKKRAQRVRDFQDGQADAFLISLKAGGFGLNLTAADYVIHLDPWWNPAVEDQASDRTHRIGQERPVTVIRMVARDTVEETVLSLHERKRDLAAAVLQGTETAGTLAAQDLAGLIQGGQT